MNERDIQKAVEMYRELYPTTYIAIVIGCSDSTICNVLAERISLEERLKLKKAVYRKCRKFDEKMAIQNRKKTFIINSVKNLHKKGNSDTEIAWTLGIKEDKVKNILLSTE